MKKKIYINGRFLTHRITGVERCAVEFSKVLDNCLNDKNFSSKYNISILAPKNTIQKIEFKNIKVQQVGYTTGHHSRI